MREMELIDFASVALQPGFAVHSIQIRETASGYHFEIELDGINDPRGAVSIKECEDFSRKFVQAVDGALIEGAGRELFPEELTPDNYSLQVSSCGVERRLRIPEELERFRGLPLKIKFLKDGKKVTEIVVFVETIPKEEGEGYTFDHYTPARQKRAPGSAKKKKDLSGSVPGSRIVLTREEILQANLYLDF